MFRRSKSQMLVDCGSEEDDTTWSRNSHTDKEQDGLEEVMTAPKELKVKKIKLKKEWKDRKPSSKDDEDFLLTGVSLSEKRGKDEGEVCNSKPEREKDKGHFWDSVTMTMRQITPIRKMDKMEGWEPPRLCDATGEGEHDDKKREDSTFPSSSSSSSLSLSSPLSSPLSLSLPSWRVGVAMEDSWRYANLADCPPKREGVATVTWAARARGKLAGIRRRGHGSLSEASWEGLK
ncbi:testis development-related protein isoform X2 [Denticeps clupeoides]|uniref:testis development-related protein isoform X2 n=1 Tax=Denticeps clupeoides TaxID=299321 RepID=UPI0010A3D1C8|nr:testis development-related protein-like isoform X2 [Denticeps clupeoides]